MGLRHLKTVVSSGWPAGSVVGIVTAVVAVVVMSTAVVVIVTVTIIGK